MYDVRKRRLPRCFLLTLDSKVRGDVERSFVRKGSICVEQDNNGSSHGEYQWVKVLDTRAVLRLEKRFLLEFTSDLSGLLEPVDPEQRLKLMENPALLAQLATLPDGAPLWVSVGQDEVAEAVLRYIGPVSSSNTAVYFGVQLKGASKGRGLSDGSYDGHQLFQCPEHCALFVPVSHVQPRQWPGPARPGPEPHHEPHRPRARAQPSRRANHPSNHPSNHAGNHTSNHTSNHVGNHASNYPGNHTSNHTSNHPSNGNVNHSNNHHSNGQQDKPSKRISVHAVPKASVLPRTSDPPQAPGRGFAPPTSSLQAPGRGSTPPTSSLQAGQRVNVLESDVVRAGEVRWCGFLPERPSAGVYVGVQLDEPVGAWDGSYNDQRLCTFTSPEHGTLVPLRHVSAVSEPKQNRLAASTQALRSMLKNALPPGVHKRPPSPTSPPLPLLPAARTALMPPNRPKAPPLPPPKPPRPKAGASPADEEGPGDAAQEEGPGGGLEPGSMVEVNEPPLFGVIRWIGRIGGVQEPVAGIELEQEVSAGSDGTYLGERHFHCAPNKALFVKLRKCRRDSRFPEPEAPVNQVERCNSIAFAEWGSERVDDHTPPLEGDEALELYQGWKRGIQGHLNSCYLDASLFSLFSCCSSADRVLFWPIDAEKESSVQAQDLLRCEIVNPLRRFGYVCASKTMALRRLLEAANNDTGFTHQEKDPEEFLNKLFQLLTVEPLLKIRSLSREPQQCHLYQLFPPAPPPCLPRDNAPPVALLSPPSRLRVSSVQALLESSFLHAGLKFVEAPSCLLLLMPRFGKDFKMFDAILPSLTIDITDLLDDSPRQCSICESVAQWECLQCHDDPDITPGRLKQFCPTCSTQVHSHKKRSSHTPLNIGVPQPLDGAPWRCPRQRMSLFAVTCIETSHYVSFVRHGDAPHDWLFFDSMADRQGGENGFNVPRVAQCAEVGRYLGLSEAELARLDSASLKGPARRLLCDAHMCLYHSPELSLYK